MVLPASIDIRYLENYVLTLRISAKTVFFMISSNDETRKCFTCKKILLDQSIDIYENIKKLIFELGFLSMPFAKVIIQWVNTVYIIEPEEMLNIYNKQELYSISQLHSDNKVVLLNTGICNNSALLFEMEKNIHGFLTRNMFQPVFFSHITPLVKYMSTKSNIQLDSFMYINWFDGNGDILIFKSGRFVVAQSYSDVEDNELFYYVMKLWEETKMDQLGDKLTYNGLSQSIVSHFKEYIKYVENFKLPSETNLWSQEIEIAPLDMISLLV